jgi:hypothetical protein
VVCGKNWLPRDDLLSRQSDWRAEPRPRPRAGADVGLSWGRRNPASVVQNLLDALDRETAPFPARVPLELLGREQRIQDGFLCRIRRSAEDHIECIVVHGLDGLRCAISLSESELELVQYAHR